MSRRGWIREAWGSADELGTFWRRVGFFLVPLGAGAAVTTYLLRRWPQGALWTGMGVALAGFAIEALFLWSKRRRPSDQTIHVPTIRTQATPGQPTVLQRDRPGWRAHCQYVSGTYDFGHGALLSAESDSEEEFSSYRCHVEGPGGYRARNSKDVFGLNPRVWHFPGEFTPKPAADPPPTGRYVVSMFGATGDVGGDQERSLAGTYFDVGNRGEYSCARGGGSPSNDEQ